MEEEQQQLHIAFFPMMAQGHILPALDMAKLFSSTTTLSGAAIKSTIITTPLNSISISNSIQASQHSSSQIDIQIIQFPEAPGVPDGVESLDQCTTTEMITGVLRATPLFQEPLERLLGDLRPDCLVADFFFPWATASAAKFNIPRLVFHGSSFFTMCADKSMNLYKPFMDVTSDSESFIIPALPHEIQFTRSQIGPQERDQKNQSKLWLEAINSDLHCYGVIVNSFYDLEADYINHYKNIWKKEAWHIGPLSLRIRQIGDKLDRGRKSAIDESECLKFLDSQKPNSVIYVCFGSETYLSSSQLYELATGLEAANHPFIWVVRRNKNGEQEERDKWLPAGFEERIKGKGIIIQGWAPQVLILDHEAVGGFVTHCGWNSTMEAICAGVPMVTWPGFGDQFYNEKLVSEVLRIGISVGAKEWSRVGNRVENEGIKSEEVERCVKMLMVGEEGEEMRRRVKEFKEKAYKAIEEGGSSYNDLNDLIKNLSSLKSQVKTI